MRLLFRVWHSLHQIERSPSNFSDGNSFSSSHAMTINKSQGQSLRQVGLVLKQPVFTHGQLYVALSRVTNKEGLKIVFDHEDSHNSTVTSNIVYQEVFRNM
ncbi:hypothetical protein PIB30_118835 [Stylosanthes scabra]|uniref:DNA replication helicase domain-containing protein n=1 Tax=Stylosanthes scabra TaxID=79078 RepID=A0ABU6W8F7_9FABA|nr:hypothetical protein [Stylosanthes scabra]